MKEEEAKDQPKKNGRGELKKTIGAVLLILILVLGFAVGTLLVIPAFEKLPAQSEEEHPESADWMSALPDNRKLSRIRIPGVHDAATEYVELAFVTRCQQKSIGELLQDGYRYLDIRLAVEKRTKGEGTDLHLRFMHGPMKCKTGFWPWEANLYLENVLEDCYKFLEEHPGETIIFVVKQESGDESVEEFQAVLNGYISEHKDKWLLKDKELPTLGEARGKLVLFRRYADEAGLGADAGLPLIWSDQGNKDEVGQNYQTEDNGGFTLAVQDRYKYTNEDKWAAFTAKQPKEADVTVSFLSTAGSWVIGHPYANAEELNGKLMQLREKEIPKGWIILDFGNQDLARKIYETN